MRRLLPLVLVCAVVCGSARGATDPRLVYLQKTLRADMVKTFKKKAPRLTIGTVTCVLPKAGVTSHCKATFTVGPIKGYYPVVAKLHDVGGTLTWTASSPKCWNAAKKRYVACT
jgi:hypothetical protein